MQNKTTIAILCGGMSEEHEVSLHSAYNILNGLDTEKYTPLLIGIEKTGKWKLHRHPEDWENPNDAKGIHLKGEGEEVGFRPGGKGMLYSYAQGKEIAKVEVVFPVLHGPMGEDGTVQGLLTLAGVPFVGAKVLGSAVGMDKDVMKRLLRDGGIPIGDFLTIRKNEPLPDFGLIQETLGLPCFIKPANMGSSVGVHKVTTEEEYHHALQDAFRYDHKVLIETYIQGREIECAVLGNTRLQASRTGEVIPKKDFYSYEAKYVDAEGAAVAIPAEISEEVMESIQELALQTFRILECKGLGRVDVFLTPGGEMYVNEINTLPGFTDISMYPKLWEVSGLSYQALLGQLITLAME